MLWVKAFHVIFMVTWFAGLFYLPRLFVYHAACEDEAGRERFKVMEFKLFVIMTIGAVATAIFGVWLLFAYAIEIYADSFWLKLKMALVLVLVGYHIYCWKLVREFKISHTRHGHKFYRWINEFPVLLLIAIILLVVVKPA